MFVKKALCIRPRFAVKVTERDVVIRIEAVRCALNQMKLAVLIHFGGFFGIRIRNNKIGRAVHNQDVTLVGLDMLVNVKIRKRCDVCALRFLRCQLRKSLNRFGNVERRIKEHKPFDVGRILCGNKSADKTALTCAEQEDILSVNKVKFLYHLQNGR